MGYSTDVQITPTPWGEDDWAEIFANKSGYYFDDYGDSIRMYEGKWYDKYDDIADISRTFPNVSFLIEGHGEEVGDDWMYRIQNGEKTEEFKRVWISKTTGETVAS